MSVSRQCCIVWRGFPIPVIAGRARTHPSFDTSHLMPTYDLHYSTTFPFFVYPRFSPYPMASMLQRGIQIAVCRNPILESVLEDGLSEARLSYIHMA